MKILVIGGTGFIGQHVTAGLAGDGHDVTVLHRGVHEPPLPVLVRHVHAESASVPIMEFPDEIRRATFDLALHMVLTGEQDAAAAVHTFKERVGRIVIVSSGDVYSAAAQVLGKEPPSGDPSAPIGENAPLRKELFAYGRHVPTPWGELDHYEKILAERVAGSEASLPATVLRLPMVYGPGDPQDRFGPYLTQMRTHRPVIFLSERQARWRFTHGYVENVAQAIALAATNPRAATRTYNVGEQPTPTLEQRLRALAEAAEWSGELAIVPESQMPAELRSPTVYLRDVMFDTTRIRAELGYAERIDAGEGYRRTATPAL
ncbi:MAG: NAD-dependent epimerase/dehydratase family protein [Gemmatimonadota bacterium]|nr:NAD-dependent epimerase/dehydratase family protein [Gemmatimonadota bacterium]